MSDSCVCVSGSTDGIGLGIAEAFARRGARLVINSHDADDHGARARLARLAECHFVQADLATVAGARAFVDGARRALGRLDTLVNNAGTFRDSRFEALDEATYDATFDLNVRGYLFASHAFVAGLAPDQQNASIVCVGSTNGLAAERESVVYDASKGAVLMLVRSLALTLAKRGVRVNGVGPGVIETALTRAGLEAPGARAALTERIPLGRIGRPEDVGEVVAFLASDAARYVTGQMLYIDGGIVAQQASWDMPR